MIELKLTVTGRQMTAIGQVMSGEVPAPAAAVINPSSLICTFNNDWAQKINVGAADELGGAEYNRQFIEWLNDDCPDLKTEQPAATTEQITQAEVDVGNIDSTDVAGDAFAKSAGSAAVTDTQPAGNPTLNTTTQTVTDTPAFAVTEPVDLAKGVNGQMIPWDARIHGKAKVKNADGTWRIKQGIDRVVLVPQVEAELLDALGAVQQQPPATQQQQPPATQQQQPPATQQQQQPPATQQQQPPATDKPTTFAQLLPLVTAAKAAGTLTDEKINETCAALGLAQFGLIATRPDLIPKAVELLGV